MLEKVWPEGSVAWRVQTRLRNELGPTGPLPGDRLLSRNWWSKRLGQRIRGSWAVWRSV